MDERFAGTNWVSLIHITRMSIPQVATANAYEQRAVQDINNLVFDESLERRESCCRRKKTIKTVNKAAMSGLSADDTDMRDAMETYQ